jgi:hypothetical protein
MVEAAGAIVNAVAGELVFSLKFASLATRAVTE